ncbi:MAG: AtpZ/AtpI family protein [Lachnospiraceae bacterium]|nr:AtpZ/AtpI family protein [Lachnospiraceae bacterium]
MKYQRNVHHAAVMITQFGLNMLVPIFICSFVGIWLDKRLGTNWIMVVLFFVGALAGGRNVFLFAKRIYSMDGDKRNRDEAVNELPTIEDIDDSDGDF